MNKRQVLAKLLSGSITKEEVVTQTRGLSFWALEDDNGQYAVEIRQHGKLLESKQMSDLELKAFKPRCMGWVITAASESAEFVHNGNRQLYPYE